MTRHQGSSLSPTQKMYDFFTTKLREAVAAKYRKRLATSCDFEQLSLTIMAAVNETLGASTLKRIWGYIEPHRQARSSSLDILARYAGYDDFATFCQSVDKELRSESGFLTDNVLYTKSIAPGMEVEISWRPDRRIVVRRNDDMTFTVVSNENSSLSVGAVLSIPYLIEGRTMIADVILPGGKFSEVYEAGRDGGVSWRQLPASATN